MAATQCRPRVQSHRPLLVPVLSGPMPVSLCRQPLTGMSGEVRGANLNQSLSSLKSPNKRIF